MSSPSSRDFRYCPLPTCNERLVTLSLNAPDRTIGDFLYTEMSALRATEITVRSVATLLRQHTTIIGLGGPAAPLWQRVVVGRLRVGARQAQAYAGAAAAGEGLQALGVAHRSPASPAAARSGRKRCSFAPMAAGRR